MSLDISAIREQLLANQAEPNPPAHTPAEKSSASPRLPVVGNEAVHWQAPHRTEVLQALRQRSTPPATPHSPEELAASPPAHQGNSDSASVSRYLQRLHTEAEIINELYRQQEAAIRKFQGSVHGLSLILMRQPHGTKFHIDQFCEIRDAALTTVIQDADERYVLTAVDLDLTLEEQQASATAATIRDRSMQRPSARAGFASAVPFSMARLRQTLSAVRRAYQTNSATKPIVTPMDILFFCGGGVIARLALELLLAANSNLWHWVVGITIGAVVLGLYRLLFSPNPDVVFVSRLFLVLVGLGIGGQL
ncbi:MAG: hypothetical protein ACFBSG_14630 [Leptolyngbyaceae cyanobacterium]